MRSTIALIVAAVVAGPAHVATQDPPARATLQIVAPILLEISEDGKPIGSTKEPRLSLSPGRHVLMFANAELEYAYSHTVELAAGDVRTITLDPRVPVNLRATPWAEVWLNGEKIGQTPMVHQLPLGTHELVFRHPRFGERRITSTIRATVTAPISVDMRKSK